MFVILLCSLLIKNIFPVDTPGISMEYMSNTETDTEKDFVLSTKVYYENALLYNQLIFQVENFTINGKTCDFLVIQYFRFQTEGISNNIEINPHSITFRDLEVYAILLPIDSIFLFGKVYEYVQNNNILRDSWDSRVISSFKNKNIYDLLSSLYRPPVSIFGFKTIKARFNTFPLVNLDNTQLSHIDYQPIHTVMFRSPIIFKSLTNNEKFEISLNTGFKLTRTICSDKKKIQFEIKYDLKTNIDFLDIRISEVLKWFLKKEHFNQHDAQSDEITDEVKRNVMKLTKNSNGHFYVSTKTQKDVKNILDEFLLHNKSIQNKFSPNKNSPKKNLLKIVE